VDATTNDDEVLTAKGAPDIRRLSRKQRVVARRMAEAKATVPDFTIEARVRMDRARSLREELRAAGVEPLPSLNDMIVKASALALVDMPEANGSYRDDTYELYPRVNVGVAVAADDALVVPTVFDADRKSLVEIAADVRELADRVRAGRISPPELAGGTFTVSNLGMFGVSRFTAVINPPQAAILAVGEVRAEVVPADDGGVAIEQIAHLVLTCDHRILYGAAAAKLLNGIRRRLEAAELGEI
jgi:pyruvate dehydrogenase E2 component (dihydrolipoamide acetyltransferase)